MQYNSKKEPGSPVRLILVILAIAVLVSAATFSIFYFVIFNQQVTGSTGSPTPIASGSPAGAPDLALLPALTVSRQYTRIVHSSVRTDNSTSAGYAINTTGARLRHRRACTTGTRSMRQLRQ